ncbi:PEP-CTERM sorting domain-containing protein [Desulfogranum mediterraneum]|uniref:PEP-CTERM sorting domain-containing protein n=1 Tax=Desulfogranum mediterraneum TaxID=160661 RepID=UPI00041CD0F9|nr:PEP-CTERM sorting domain-containing protein [Desulfogranum mediterraneum]
MIKKIFLPLLLVLIGSSISHALFIDLVHELDGNSDGSVSYGTITVTEIGGGDLRFEITAEPTALGSPLADIHELYFNLLNDVPATDLLVSDFTPTTLGPISSVETPLTIAGAPNDLFEYGINFGNGGGPAYRFTSVAFTLSASVDLFISHLLETSDPNNTGPVTMAVHFQETAIFGDDSETIGGSPGIPIPEPTTMLLFSTGLVGLLGFIRKNGK